MTEKNTFLISKLIFIIWTAIFVYYIAIEQDMESLPNLIVGIGALAYLNNIYKSRVIYLVFVIWALFNELVAFTEGSTIEIIFIIPLMIAFYYGFKFRK